MKSSDTNFVYSTWLKSYRESLFAQSMSNTVYFKEHAAIITKIMESPDTNVTMIVDKDDDDHLYGYVVASVYPTTSVIHFCYVKYNYRRLGLMDNTLQTLHLINTGTPTVVTHIHRNHGFISKRCNLEYNPYLLGEIE